MEDPVYAKKYEEGAEQGDLAGKLVQAMDADHTKGMTGMHLSAGAQSNPAAAMAIGGEIGWEVYHENWLTGRAALAGYLGQEEGYAGLDLSLRSQTPTRLAPFVGVGMFHGASKTEELADNDGLDNDDDDWIDESGETDEGIDAWISSVYPEVGVHWWINGSWRLTASGRYFVTTEGRNHDDWLIGSQISVFFR